jgi:hypothetical protein
LADEGSSRDAQIAEIAVKYVEFIETQTGLALFAPELIDAARVNEAFSTLDAALDQMSDFADVYGSERMHALEALVLPTAALVGEYLIHGADAVWVEPVFEADTTLVIAMPDGVAVDLTGAVRAALLSGVPNLRIMAGRLIDPESA